MIPRMARLARAVFPIPHHVTQRGNGRARTFFSDADYQLKKSRGYLTLGFSIYPHCLVRQFQQSTTAD